MAGPVEIRAPLAEPGVLPHPPRPPVLFTGRVAELADLQTRYAQRTERPCLAVQGMGGIGKTGLVKQFCHDLFNSGQVAAVFWAMLGPQPAPADILRAWGRLADPAFQLDEGDPTELPFAADRVRALLSDLIKRNDADASLVVLDDVWEGASAALADLLLRAAPIHATVILTTRSEDVARAFDPRWLKLEPLNLTDAAELLDRHLTTLPLRADQRERLALIVGQHPLALELAAAALAQSDPQPEVDAFIERYTSGLPAGSPFASLDLELSGLPEDNLRLVLARSYDQLEAGDRHAFTTLGILAYGQPFSAALCDRLWEAPAKPILRRLRAHALIQPDDETGWYRQHPLLHAYAHGLLRTDADHYRHTMAQYAGAAFTLLERMLGASREAWALQVDPHLPQFLNLGSLFERALREALGPVYIDLTEPHKTRPIPDLPVHLDGEILDQGMTLALVLLHYAEKRAHVSRVGRPIFLAGLVALRLRGVQPDAPADWPGREILFLSRLGATLFRIGEPSQGLAYSEAAMALARRPGVASDDLAEACNALGVMLSEVGRLDEGIRYLGEALTLHEQAGHDGPALTVRMNLAAIQIRVGNVQAAHQTLTTGLTLARRLRRTNSEAAILKYLAELCVATSDVPRAIQYLDQAAALYQAMRSEHERAEVLVNKAVALGQSGRTSEAIALFREIEPLLRTQPGSFALAIMLGNLGETLRQAGQIEAARGYLSEALALHQNLDNREGMATVLTNLALLDYGAGKREQALAQMEQALTLVHAMNRPLLEATLLHNIGSTFIASREYQTALSYLDRAFNVRRAINDRRGQALTLGSKAFVYGEMSQIGRALEVLDTADQIAAEIDDVGLRVMLLNNIGELHRQQRQYDPAIARLSQALALLERPEVDLPVMKAHVLNNLALIYDAQDRPQQARRTHQEALSLRRRANDGEGIIKSLYNLSFYAPPAQALTLLEEARALAHVLQRQDDEALVAQRMAELDGLSLAPDPLPDFDDVLMNDYNDRMYRLSQQGGFDEPGVRAATLALWREMAETPTGRMMLRVVEASLSRVVAATPDGVRAEGLLTLLRELHGGAPLPEALAATVEVQTLIQGFLATPDWSAAGRYLQEHAAFFLNSEQGWRMMQLFVAQNDARPNAALLRQHLEFLEWARTDGVESAVARMARGPNTNGGSTE